MGEYQGTLGWLGGDSGEGLSAAAEMIGGVSRVTGHSAPKPEDSISALQH